MLRAEWKGWAIRRKILVGRSEQKKKILSFHQIIIKQALNNVLTFTSVDSLKSFFFFPTAIHLLQDVLFSMRDVNTGTKVSAKGRGGEKFCKITQNETIVSLLRQQNRVANPAIFLIKITIWNKIMQQNFTEKPEFCFFN